jgi:4-hydroxybutyryl-CoA dehydratase/vinylacetyl-CoA-Delta-isomerase
MIAGQRSRTRRGAGSPQGQRLQIARQMDIEAKKKLARKLPGIEGA